MAARSKASVGAIRWWKRWRPRLDIEYIEEPNGRWMFVMRHDGETEAVGSIGGFARESEAREAVSALSKGFRIGSEETRK